MSTYTHVDWFFLLSMCYPPTLPEAVGVLESSCPTGGLPPVEVPRVGDTPPQMSTRNLPGGTRGGPGGDPGGTRGGPWGVRRGSRGSGQIPRGYPEPSEGGASAPESAQIDGTYMTLGPKFYTKLASVITRRRMHLNQ